jgi:TonB-linked SusC/RagA family outer membrane protein
MNYLLICKGRRVLWYAHILVLCLTFTSAFANSSPPFTLTIQQQKISGTITDAHGALPGVTILVKGTTTAAISGADGTYSIAAEPTDTLVFNSIGYELQELTLGSQTVLNIIMKEDVTSLEEVVINAGYYTVKEKESTGSIARITSKDIDKQPVNDILAAMQGKLTGVDIVSTTGLPGGGYQVRVRGQSSITAGNEPLYVVDGVPFDSGSLGSRDVSGGILPGGTINPLNTIDPSLIASVEVLKDADATAIYGSRGSNGVILITTKRGNAGRTKFSVEAFTTVISTTRMLKLLNTEQYLDMRREALANDGITEIPAWEYDVNGTWDQNRYTNWQKELVGNAAYNHTVRLSATGGSESTRFILGGSFMKETTVFPGDFNYKKTTAFANITHHSEDERLRIQFSANYGQDKNFLPSTDLSRVARILPPNAPELYDENGQLNWEGSTWTNPLAALNSNYNNQTNNLMANTVISYRVLDGLELKVNLGYNRSELTEIQVSPNTIYDPAFGLTSASSTATRNQNVRNSWIVEPQLDYKHDFSWGSINLTLGSTFQDKESDQLTLSANGFADNYLITNFSAANTVRFINELTTQYRYQAGYARVNFNLHSKYILNFTGRRDGSSRFGTDNRFANFGAIGGAWLFSKEKFADTLTWLDFGKLRASYGITGNDQIGDYQYLNTYSITDGGYNGAIGLTPSRLFNSGFAWEKNKKVEVALEAEFLKGAVNVEAAYYNNRSDNQLLGIPLPGTTGFSSINTNLNATVENSGWEIRVGTNNIKNETFKWNTSLQFTLPKNKLVAFEGLENSSYVNQLVIGQPLSIYKLYKNEGVNPETGLFNFTDYNGDNAITVADRQFVAYLTPEFYGSLSNTLQYKNWSLDITFQFMKKKGLNEFYTTEPPGTMLNQPQSALNQWQNPGDNASMQAYTTGWNFDAYNAYSQFTQSSGVISDASFIRLKTLALSYRFMTDRKGISGCTLFAQGQNLLTFTKFKGGDPEQAPGFLAPVRRISFGVRMEL